MITWRGLGYKVYIWATFLSLVNGFRGTEEAHNNLIATASTNDVFARMKVNLKHEFTASDSVKGFHGMQQLPDERNSKTIEYQSFSDRLGNSMKAIILGWVLIIFSIPILWLSETRTAEVESLILTGQAACRTVKGKVVEMENRGRLVHIANEPLQGLGKLKDYQFDVVFESGCVRFRSVVEVFQYIQHETKEKLSKGKDTVAQYSYTQDWRGQFYDSLGDQAYANTRPNGVRLGTMLLNNSLVAFGDGFELTEELIIQCNGFQSAAKRIGDLVTHRNGYIFHNGGDSYYYFRKDQQGWRGDGTPMIGDVRVKFEYVPDGPATVIALQVEGNTSYADYQKDSFLPYRLIRRGWCGLNEEKEKELLTLEGKKLPEELAAENSKRGLFMRCCCMCNSVATCFSSAMTPEIYHLWEKDMSAAMCFEEIKARKKLTAWIIRFMGWALMYAGFYTTFSPIPMTITVIPYLGPYLASFADWLILVFCLMATLAMATLIICSAYLKYRPLTAMLYLLAAGFVVMTTIAVSRFFNKIVIA